MMHKIVRSLTILILVFTSTMILSAQIDPHADLTETFTYKTIRVSYPSGMTAQSVDRSPYGFDEHIELHFTDDDTITISTFLTPMLMDDALQMIIGYLFDFLAPDITDDRTLEDAVEITSFAGYERVHTFNKSDANNHAYAYVFPINYTIVIVTLTTQVQVLTLEEQLNLTERIASSIAIGNHEPFSDLALAMLAGERTRSAPLDAMAQVDLFQLVADTDESLFVNIPETWIFDMLSGANLATSQAVQDKMDTEDTEFAPDETFILVLRPNDMAYYGESIGKVLSYLTELFSEVTYFYLYDNLEMPVYYLTGIADIEIKSDLFILVFEMEDDQLGVMVGITGDYDQNEATILAIQQSVRYANIAPLVAPLDAMAEVDLPQVASNADETVFVNIPEAWVFGDVRGSFILANSAALFERYLNPTDTSPLAEDDLLLQIGGDNWFGTFDKTVSEMLITLQSRQFIQSPFIPYDLTDGTVYFVEERHLTAEGFTLIFQNPDGTTGVIYGMTGGSYADHEPTVLAILQTIRTSR